jgi:N-sulfoglucosamine sulfohydrolase
MSRSVLIIIADDWSPLARAYDWEQPYTPHIDRFASESMTFRRAFCTSPSCAASRANILTGLYSHTHGQYGHSHDIHGFRTHDHIRSLPAVLRDAGVRTGLIGKHHIAPMSVYPFDVSVQSKQWSETALADDALKFLSDCAGRPFFLQVASMYPHRTAGTFDTNIGDPHLTLNDTQIDPALIALHPTLPDLPEVRQDWAAYWRFIARFDRTVGNILNALECSGRAQDTLVLLMSDHGMPFPFSKGSAYDTGHHCPLIVRDPRNQTPRSTSAIVNWSNIFPTICDFLQVPIPKHLPERSFLPVIEGGDVNGFGRTFFSHTFHGVTNYQPYRAIRTERWKFVHHLAPELNAEAVMPSDLHASATWQAVKHHRLGAMGVRPLTPLLRRAPESLFDIENDPWETTNLIENDKFKHVADELRKELSDFRMRTLDPWLQVDLQTQ